MGIGVIKNTEFDEQATNWYYSSIIYFNGKDVYGDVMPSFGEDEECNLGNGSSYTSSLPIHYDNVG